MGDLSIPYSPLYHQKWPNLCHINIFSSQLLISRIMRDYLHNRRNGDNWMQNFECNKTKTVNTWFLLIWLLFNGKGLTDLFYILSKGNMNRQQYLVNVIIIPWPGYLRDFFVFQYKKEENQCHWNFLRSINIIIL